MRLSHFLPAVVAGLLLGACQSPPSPQPAAAPGRLPPELIFHGKHPKPIDSQLKVAVGTIAPDFTLPSIDGKSVRLSHFRGRKNVVLSFVPGAFTPVCSEQWPGYGFVKSDLLDSRDAVMLGITVDSLPSLHAWVVGMGGLPFPVLSDFWPHGAVAARYGVLRGDGVTERALFVIDKQGVLRWLDVHPIHQRPPMEALAAALDAMR